MSNLKSCRTVIYYSMYKKPVCCDDDHALTNDQIGPSLYYPVLTALCDEEGSEASFERGRVIKYRLWVRVMFTHWPDTVSGQNDYK